MSNEQPNGLPHGEELAEYIRIYIGPNAKHYERLINSQTNANPSRWKAGWCWGGLFLTFGWPMFRKQWGLALLLFGYTVIAKVVVDQMPLDLLVEIMPVTIILYYAPAFAVAIWGKSYYVNKAKYNVKRILLDGDDRDIAIARIQAKGGVSWVGGIIGSLPHDRHDLNTLSKSHNPCSAINAYLNKKRRVTGPGVLHLKQQSVLS